MLILADVTLFANVRQNGIRCGYRPDWRPIDGGQLNCAAVWLPADMALLPLGASTMALLQPLSPDLWGFAAEGMILHACEGPHVTAMAQIRRIFDVGSSSKITFPAAAPG